MDNKRLFYGTPLTKSLPESGTKDGGYSRRHKTAYAKQQYVRDEQGRRRFHGAFTGGFSAGYYNTVDTIEGFKPCEFVTHRGRKRGEDCPELKRAPDYYMDDEDFGEFGIAPKKLCISDKFASPSIVTTSSIGSEIKNIFPSPTIGEQILRRLGGTSRIDQNISDAQIALNKFITECVMPYRNNFYGLGYEPLAHREISGLYSTKASSKNPLKALIDGGKRIEISGEAFSGVEDDEDYVNHSDAYGYESLSDYQVDSHSSSQRKSKHSKDLNEKEFDSELIKGFVLAKDSTIICDTASSSFPLLEIPSDWVMPFRGEPYIVTTSFRSSAGANSGHPNSSGSINSLFSEKFTSASEHLRTAGLENQSGLFQYSELKASAPKPQTKDDCQEKVELTISRQVFEWRPCSLLCKRFSIANPYPDTTYFGLKPDDLISSTDLNTTESCDKLNSSQTQLGLNELRKSIFNVVFANHSKCIEYNSSESLETGVNENTILSGNEYEPQILQSIDVEHDIERRQEKEDEDGGLVQVDSDHDGSSKSAIDEDIFIIEPQRTDPEIIEISSSSSASPLIGAGDGAIASTSQSSYTNNDLYGPPLPPSDEKKSCQRGKSKRHKKRKKQGKTSSKCKRRN